MTGQRTWRRPRAPRFVLRDTTPLIAFGLAAVVGAVLVADPLFVGDAVVFAITAPFVAAALGVLWLLLVHPHVRYDEREVTVTGIGRVHRIPWGRIAAVRQQLALTFTLDDGRTIRASAVTAPRDSGLVLGAVTRGRFGAGAVGAHSNADALRAFREMHATPSAGGESETSVESRWDVGPLVVVGVLVLVAVVDAFALVVG